MQEQRAYLRSIARDLHIDSLKFVPAKRPHDVIFGIASSTIDFYHGKYDYITRFAETKTESSRM